MERQGEGLGMLFSGLCRSFVTTKSYFSLLHPGHTRLALSTITAEKRLMQLDP